MGVSVRIRFNFRVFDPTIFGDIYIDTCSIILAVIMNEVLQHDV